MRVTSLLLAASLLTPAAASAETGPRWLMTSAELRAAPEDPEPAVTNTVHPGGEGGERTRCRRRGGKGRAGDQPGNPYDGHTLGEALEQVAILTGHPPKRAVVERGYKGHGVQHTQVLISGTAAA